MSRKHKSRKPKITQSNVPAAFAKEKKLGQDNVKNETLPEKNHDTKNDVTDHATPSHTEASTAANTTAPVSEKQESVPNHEAYSLDAHYAAQEKNERDVVSPTPEAAPASTTENAENISSKQDDTSDTVSGSLKAEAPPSLSEYEQLKRKNRRRLVGAGALVLVAGSLFAAASKDSAQSNPKLTATKTVEQQVLQPDILRPTGSENQVDLSMDNEKGAPLVLRNNAMSASANRNYATAQQNRNNANNTPNTAQRNTTNVAANNGNRNNTNTTTNYAAQNSSNDRAKAREEARLAEERRKKAQSKAAEAEAKRQETERAIASKAKSAQAAADRNRNAERAQLTASRAAEEKQRAQRQAAASQSSKSSNSSGGSKAIQAGAFSDREAARRMQQQLKNMNYAARVEEVQTSKGKIYRVRTGDFSNQADAKNALNKLQNKGVNGMVVGK